jgi:hypothetical protein
MRLMNKRLSIAAMQDIEIGDYSSTDDTLRIKVIHVS